jgi:hypothetical protein
VYTGRLQYSHPSHLPRTHFGQGKYKGCNCLTIGEIVDAYNADTAKYADGLDWLDLQQKILDDWANKKSDSPYCNYGASPRGGRIPKEYCNCGDNNRKTLTYSVATSTDNACPYTTNDGPTVTFQPESTATLPATPVVSCAPEQDRWFSSSDGYNWISEFCNNKNGRTLKLRPNTGDLVDASSQVWNNNRDPYVRIYAYIDNACKEKKTMSMNKQECAAALYAIMHDCKCSPLLVLG